MKIRTEDAVKEYGSKSKLARALDITRQAVNNWGEYVPEGVAYKLHYMRAYANARDKTIIKKGESSGDK